MYSWSVKMGPIGVGLHCSLRNNPEERRSHLLRSGGLKSRIAYKRPFPIRFCWNSSRLQWVLHIMPIAFSLMSSPQIIKLLIKQCYSHSHHFISLKHEYCPQQGNDLANTCDSVSIHVNWQLVSPPAECAILMKDMLLCKQDTQTVEPTACRGTSDFPL